MVTTTDSSSDLSRIFTIPYCPQIPQSKQARFLMDFSLEALFGGAAAGGKSSAMLMAALMFVDVPSYSALILRKSYADLALPGAIMDRANDWIRGSDARWNDTTHTWTFPSGAKLQFGYLQSANDRYRYQSAELQFVGFDELTQFKEIDYRYLFSRVRRPSSLSSSHPLTRVPLRIRGATNPGGVGHAWVYHRFVQPYVSNPYPPRSFHPATLEDNAYVDAPSYDRALQELDSVTRAQLRSGNWDIRPEGRMFKRSWFELVRRVDVPTDCTWVRYWDLAATPDSPDKDPDYTASCLLGWSPSQKSFYAETRRMRGTPAEVEGLIRKVAEDDKNRFGTGHVSIYMEQEPGASGKIVIAHYRTVLLGHVFDGHNPTGNKIVRAELVRNKAEMGMIRLVMGASTEEFLDEAEIFPDGEHDDMIDAISGALGKLAPKVAIGNPVAPVGLEQQNRWTMATGV